MKLASSYLILDCIIVMLALLIACSLFICLFNPGLFVSFWREEAFFIENDIPVSLLSTSNTINHTRGLKIFKIDIQDRILLNNYSDKNIYKIIVDLNSGSIKKHIENKAINQ